MAEGGGKEALGTEGQGEVKGAVGSGSPVWWSSTVGGVWEGRWESELSSCFSAGLGVFNINSNDCGGKIIGRSQIRRGKRLSWLPKTSLSPAPLISPFFPPPPSPPTSLEQKRYYRPGCFQTAAPEPSPSSSALLPLPPQCE